MKGRHDTETLNRAEAEVDALLHIVAMIAWNIRTGGRNHGIACAVADARGYLNRLGALCAPTEDAA